MGKKLTSILTFCLQNAFRAAQNLKNAKKQPKNTIFRH